MYVKNIELRNFKNLESLEQSFEGVVYLFKGDNEFGKSALLSAITAVLTGERSADILKKGEQQGYVKSQIGDRYEVILEFAESNPRGTLKLKDLESGMVQRKGVKSILQSLFNYSDFDAFRFVQMSETAEGRRKQVEIVKSLLPNETQKRMNEIGNKIPAIKEERKKMKALLRDREVQLKNFNLDAETLKKTDYADIEKLKKQRDEVRQKLNDEYKKNKAHNEQLKEDYDKKIEELLKEIEAHNSNVYAARSWVNKVAENLKELNHSKDRSKAILKEALDVDVLVVDNENIKSIEESINHTRGEIPAEREFKTEKSDIPVPEYIEGLPDDSELKKIDDQIDKAHEINRVVDEARRYHEVKDDVESLKVEVETYNEDIANLQNEHEELIAQSDLPIKGLSFGDEGLLLNDIPVRPDTISTSQEMELAFNIALAKNKEVQVFKIAQGESLGPKRFRELVKLAYNSGFQGFIERVSADQELVIEQYHEETNTSGENKQQG